MTTLVKSPRTPSPTSPKLTVLSDGNNDKKGTAFSPPASRSAPNTPTSASSSPTSCNGGNGKNFES